VAVPAGTLYNFRNTGTNPLVLYTVYGPAEHAAGAVYATKEEADAAEEFGQGRASRRLTCSRACLSRSGPTGAAVRLAAGAVAGVREEHTTRRTARARTPRGFGK
jgi:hypothetical protein